MGKRKRRRQIWGQLAGMLILQPRRIPPACRLPFQRDPPSGCPRKEGAEATASWSMAAGPPHQNLGVSRFMYLATLVRAQSPNFVGSRRHLGRRFRISVVEPRRGIFVRLRPARMRFSSPCFACACLPSHPPLRDPLLSIAWYPLSCRTDRVNPLCQ